MPFFFFFLKIFMIGSKAVYGLPVLVIPAWFCYECFIMPVT